MPPMPRVAVLAALALALPGCGIASGDERITLKVLAASSLTEAFEELGTAYGAAAKNVTVRFEFAGSQDLAMDVDEREPADVLVTADQTAMEPVVEKVTRRRVFAYNSMTIAVAPGNPRHVRGLASLGDRRLRVVLGGSIVPVGRYAAQVLAKAGVTVRPRSEEADSRTVLTRVRTGEADAGIVYVTDMRSAGIAATSVPIPVQQNVTAAYVAAELRASAHETAAKAFVAWLGSPTAKTVLRKYGFPTP
jgi:molybdate transport system substrate-binding protein